MGDHRLHVRASLTGTDGRVRRSEMDINYVADAPHQVAVMIEKLSLRAGFSETVTPDARDMGCPTCAGPLQELRGTVFCAQCVIEALQALAGDA